MRKHVNLNKNVPGRSTKLVSQLGELDYESRRRVLKLSILAYRRKIETITRVCKLTNQLYKNSASERLFEPNARISRGNKKKVMSKNKESKHTILLHCASDRKLEQSARRGDVQLQSKDIQVKTRQALGCASHNHLSCGMF